MTRTPETDALTIRGHEILLRAISAGDEDRLVAFHSALSEASTYRRFLSFHPRLSADELHRFTHGDDRVALAQLLGWKDEGRAPRDHHAGIDDAAKRARSLGGRRQLV